MATPVSELQKINPSNIVELFQLQLDSTIHGANTTYYFHNGVSENNNSNLIFDNIEYTRMPIEADGFEFNEDAYYGRVKGMWTHTNTRKDKFDMFPQEELLDMLISL